MNYPNDPLYLFDVDGTLTPARQPMDPVFHDWFVEWANGRRVGLVSGSDWPKTLEQLGPVIPNLCEVVFSCSGNEVRRAGQVVHKEEWELSTQQTDFLYDCLRRSNFPLRTGLHIEERTGSCNFSVVGRNATFDQRRSYVEWDKKHGSRQLLRMRIMQAFPDLDAQIGGETGLDIFPVGKDKRQVVGMVEGPILFYGDQCGEGGNDASLANAVDWFYHTKGPEDTMGSLGGVMPKVR